MEKLGYELNPKGEEVTIRGGETPDLIRSGYTGTRYSTESLFKKPSARPIMKAELK